MYCIYIIERSQLQKLRNPVLSIFRAPQIRTRDQIFFDWSITEACHWGRSWCCDFWMLPSFDP